MSNGTPADACSTPDSLGKGQSSPARHTASDLLRGALFVVAAEFMFASMGASIRMVSAEIPNAGVVFFRNLIGISVLLPLLLYRGLSDLRTQVPHLHLLRGLTGLSAMYCFFYAIANMPLAEAMLLKLSAPLFIPLVALFWLGEAVSWRVRWALLSGFAGVTLILRPDFTGLPPAALIALLGGLFAAVAKVSVRRLSRSEPTTRIVFYFALTGTLVSSVPMLFYWQAPSTEAWIWLLAVGLFATLGQLLLTQGLSLAPAARVGAFGFFAVIFGAFYGWLFWNEMLRWTTLAGSLLIIYAGIAASRGDRIT